MRPAPVYGVGEIKSRDYSQLIKELEKSGFIEKEEVWTMRKINIGGFTRISKRAAEKLYNAGETVRICAITAVSVLVSGRFEL